MKWMSIRDIELLIKKGIYQQESGGSQNLIYDRLNEKIVGHIEQGRQFKQNRNYQPSDRIIRELEHLEGGAWNNDLSDWDLPNTW